MKNKNYTTTKEILNEFPELKFYQLEYILKANRIDYIKKGQGFLRQYPLEAISQIKSILKSRNNV